MPQSVGGQPIRYTEGSVSEMNQDAFYDRAIAAAGGDIRTARVAIGLGRDTFTLSVLRVPGSDARTMVDLVIADSGFNPTARQVVKTGGKSTTVLTLAPTTADRAYIYTHADTLAVITTSEPALAAEALQALP